MKKKCNKCGVTQPLCEFYRHKLGRDGTQSHCKACTRAYKKKWKLENIEKVRACRAKDNATYRRKHKEKIAAIDAAYQKANREKIVAYRKANKDRFIQYRKDYSANNPDYSRVAAAKRRFLIANSGGSHTPEDIRQIFFLQKGRCACCKASIRDGYHADHIIPLTKGGDNGRLNIQLLCPPCNLTKHAKHPIDFMQERGYLL